MEHSMLGTDILTPILFLVAWTCFICIWMYAKRIPAMAKIEPQDAARTSKLADMLPAKVQQVADNYNHLFEQPTIFYAIAVYVALLGHDTTLNVACAWLFVSLRIVHSIVHATFNLVMLRFSIFAIAQITLMVIVVNELLKYFGAY